MAVLKYWDPTANDYVPLSVVGESGTLILTGTTPPTIATGVAGNFYLDSVAHILYGPKTGSLWPVAIDGSGAGSGGTGVRTFEQTFASAIGTWTIAHNFNTRVVEVNCYDPTGVDQYEVEADVVDANTVVVRWYYPTAGIARVMA